MALSKKLRDLLTVAFCDKKLANELADSLDAAGTKSPLKVQKGSISFTAGQQLDNFDTGINLPANAVLTKIIVKLKSAYFDNFNNALTGPFGWQFIIGGQNYQATNEAEFWTTVGVVTSLAGPFGTSQICTLLPSMAADGGILAISTFAGSADPSAGPYDLDMGYDIWVEYYEGS